jgi:ABC-type transport system involved in multi-copper enzyme maturation permease subunit
MRYDEDDWQDDNEVYARRPRRRREAGGSWGVASLGIAIVTLVVEFVAIATAGIIAGTDGDLDESSPMAIAIGLVILLGLLSAIVGIVIGTLGVTMNSRTKGLAIAGAVLNGLICLGVLGIMALGALVG